VRIAPSNKNTRRRGYYVSGTLCFVDSGEEPAIFFTRGGGVGGYLSLGGVEIKMAE